MLISHFQQAHPTLHGYAHNITYENQQAQLRLETAPPLMKVLLRNRANGLYFQGPNQWTDRRHEAFVFEGSARALLSAREMPCDTLELLLVFDDPWHDLRLPLPKKRQPLPDPAN